MKNVKLLLVSLLIFFLIGISLGCGGPSERGAQIAALGFAERHVGFNLHDHDHDLAINQSRVDENIFYVEGTVKCEANLIHHDLFVMMEVDEDEGKWYLRELVFNGQELYYSE